MNLFILKTWLEAKFRTNNEIGASVIEYGVLLALIAVIAIAVEPLGNSQSGSKSTVCIGGSCHF